ncbi:BTAD domain-containing putative transcriptional regulator [Actinomycetospora corticicola]|uniref:Putative ATPase/DNA-binding SARP family transcriptional activator/tetratricopeptide (TPR) repeat protein n=1 Tax=Actinomycetospora corticicola TaxID=663602 RepID=A0A7Y9E1Y9_9PSEU|nr:BTAD domain-containing putative transcriptional regulator [Actinomycetospora corticicola]NYD39470.1 putative ATPase/DNA-binding SARP family transcriptional activator/tetratricopeptide (TPR) repeat protein [Actinomycetospora corticicola]
MIRLLGPVSVVDDDGRELLPAGPRVRGLLARLALDAGRPVDAATLVDALWGEDPPSTANALQSLASRLRRAVGAQRVRSSSGGYLLAVDPDDVDALRFATLRRTALAEPDDERACALLTEALALWQDPVLGGLGDLPFAGPAAARLADARAGAAEELAARGLRGRAPDAGRDTLVAVLDADPLRETTAVALARGLSAGGRRADALAVLDRTRTTLAEELGVDPGPELARVRTELLQDAAEPAPVVGKARPQALTSFVGREDDLARLRGLVATSRLVTITGPGGAGKTRLATEAVRDEPRRVAVAELAALTGGDQVAPGVLHAVGGPELALGDPGAADSVLPRLRAALAGRETVLVLDNCEHLVEASAVLVHDLLTAVPGLVVLATSREPLGVPGEVLHPLGALDDAHATQLFAERAAAVRPGFDLSRHRTVVREICRRLDGQPLPIELAAARVRSLEPAEIAERLADRFRLLTTGSRTALPRHQTLRAVVDWSWDLLSDAERTLAARFGAFAGAVDLRAVEAVCGDEAFDLLGLLVEKSLVVAVPGEPTRYRMLETIREYALARLDAAVDRDAVVAAHAAWVLAVLEPVEPALRGGGQLDALAVVRAVDGEAVRALERAVEAGDAVRGHRLLAALTWSWVVRGDMASLIRWSERLFTLPVPTTGTDVAVNRSLHTVLLAVTVPGTDVRGGSAAVLAMLPELPRPLHPVVALHEPTARAFLDDDRSGLVDLAAAADDPWLRAAAAQLAAVHAENAGDLAGQRRALRAAYDGFAALGDRFGLGMTTFSLGELEDLAGDRVAARRTFAAAIALAAELDNADDVPQYRMRLAALAARDGDATEAREQLRLATEAARGSNDPGTAAWLAWSGADVQRRLGDPDRALATLRAHPPSSGDGLGPGRAQREAMVHDLTASALIDLGRLDEARVEVEAARRAGEEAKDGPVRGQVAETAARLALAEGDPGRAADLLAEAVARRGALHLGDPDVVATRDGCGFTPTA